MISLLLSIIVFAALVVAFTFMLVLAAETLRDPDKRIPGPDPRRGR